MASRIMSSMPEAPRRCLRCGQELAEGANSCSSCGTAASEDWRNDFAESEASMESATEVLPESSAERGDRAEDDGSTRPTRSFMPGDRVAGRYRIVRFLGHGGMGEVYEAEDHELRGHVALKTVRGALAEDPRVIDRFKREIHLARRVTHPNICRVFDIGHHRGIGAGGGTGDVTFLTMELLDGETLSDRIDRRGRLPTTEALPIIRQMAAGLAAAHEEGIVHRDFKAGNVMLVSAQDGGTRAIITDFGLARGLAGSDRFASGVSLAGHILGTPGYMSPEQVRGETVGPATDIYALGVVMYEMVTGKLPFEASTPFAVGVKHLTEIPPAPRTFAPDLDLTWERVILRCLGRCPADRFVRATDVVKALDGDAVPQQGAVRSMLRRRLAACILASALVLGSLLAFGVFHQPGSSQTERGLPAQPVPPSPLDSHSSPIRAVEEERGAAPTPKIDAPQVPAQGDLRAAGRLCEVATAAHARGDLAGSKGKFDEALLIFTGLGDKNGEATALAGLGDVLLDEADIAGARLNHEKALALRETVGDRDAVAASQLALALLALEEGRAVLAESAAREVATYLKPGRALDLEALAQIVLARSLLELNRHEEADTVAKKAMEMAQESRSIEVRLRAAIVRARVQAALGNYDGAVQGLQSAREEASKAGQVGIGLEADVVIGQTELLSGRPVAGRMRIASVGARARQLGYALIAQKAAAAQAAGPQFGR